MKSIATMYCKKTCPYCVYAENLLTQYGIKIKKIYLDYNLEQRTLMIERTGRKTVPQIFIGDTYIGGYDDLEKMNLTGQLLDLLKK